jgi:hypothetical protein
LFFKCIVNDYSLSNFQLLNWYGMWCPLLSIFLQEDILFISIAFLKLRRNLKRRWFNSVKIKSLYNIKILQKIILDYLNSLMQLENKGLNLQAASSLKSGFAQLSNCHWWCDFCYTPVTTSTSYQRKYIDMKLYDTVIHELSYAYCHIQKNPSCL